MKYHTQKIYRAFDAYPCGTGGLHAPASLGDVAPAHSTDALSPENRAFAPETEAFGRQCAVGDDQPASAPLAVTRANPCERLALQHGLTDRERQTLELLALGETVAAIARALDVSENTVKTYTKRVYRKLDVHSKQDIIDLCREG
ncbi:MAG: response regulator transcription factor [Eggerthella lenta]